MQRFTGTVYGIQLCEYYFPFLTIGNSRENHWSTIILYTMKCDTKGLCIVIYWVLLINVSKRLTHFTMSSAFCSHSMSIPMGIAFTKSYLPISEIDSY